MTRRTADAKFVGSGAQVGDSDRIEALFDSMRQIGKYGFCYSPGVSSGLLFSGRIQLRLPERDRAFQGTNDIAQLDFVSRSGKCVAALGATLGSDDADPFEFLENLLQKSRRNRLSLRDILHLSRATRIVKCDVEQRTDSITTFVGELHSGGIYDLHIGNVKNRSAGAILRLGYWAEVRGHVPPGASAAKS